MASQSAGSSKMSDADGPKKARATASQFFNKDEDSNSKPQDSQSSTYDRVVELINSAAVMQKGQDKINNLKQVQELIIHKSSDLLDNFLDEMLGFQSDRSNDVKKFIVSFMEEACKKDNECLPKVLPSVIMLLGDDDVNVQKKVILSVTNMFKITLGWITKTKKPRGEMSEVWNHLVELKSLMYDMLESANDGIRTHVVKFLEGLTLVFSRRTADSEIPKNQEKEISLDQIPETNQILKVNTLEEYGFKSFNTLLQFQASPHVSSINLMTVMNALSHIGKQRPQFFDQIVQSFEALHVNLPPTLAKSQVSSVRKNLKNQLLSLLKHPCSVDFIPQVSTLLTDLGASQSEIAKNTPKDTESRKRKAPPTIPSSNSYSSKKTKVEVNDDEDDGMTPWVDRTAKKSKPEPAQKHTAIDVTAEDIQPRLVPQNVADLVLLSMVMLPESMPAQFQSTYTPIAAAGTDAQISHIARLLATQLTMAGLGKGIGELKMQAIKEAGTEKLADDEQPSSPKQLIQTVLGLKTDEPEVKKPKMSQLPLPPTARKMKHFQLSSVTKPMASTISNTMLTNTLTRIIDTEKPASQNHVEHHRTKVLAMLTSLSEESLKDALQQYIFDDVRSHQDLCFAWLYQEYANCQGYSANPLSSAPAMGRYDECLTRLLVGLLALELPHADNLFNRILLEAPIITDNSISIIRRYCSEGGHTEAGMSLLTQLINNRPAHRLTFLDLMLEFTLDKEAEVRSVSIKAAESLHTSGLMQGAIEKFAITQLRKLLLPKPPATAATKEQKEKDVIGMEVVGTWTEDTIKAHLYLLLALLPANHKLIHELANIYTATSADIKRTILRVLEAPVRGMGMDSPELLTLVEDCPKGSETLVMRVIHILTDKAVPSPELVDRIRDLYHKRVPDVRFLIPVLNGLKKNEVMDALPKLIKLNPLVVKEVFNRLMGSHVNNESVYHSPLTPIELLVALHNIDPTKCDMKTIIKAANLCLSERNIYTQEVMALVMQKLMEIEPLPTLLMRTVIQSLTMYPRLQGVVLNILQRLIGKRVWKQKKVWEGFIRCCQRVLPQSLNHLLQLPAEQLKECFDLCPDMRAPLLAHVKVFTPDQWAHLNPSVAQFLKQEEEEVRIVEGKAEDNVPKECADNKVEKDNLDVHRISTISDASPHKSESTPSKTLIHLSTSNNSSEDRGDDIDHLAMSDASKDPDAEKRKENKDPDRNRDERKNGEKSRRERVEDSEDGRNQKEKTSSGGRSRSERLDEDKNEEKKKEDKDRRKDENSSEKDKKSSSKSSRRDDSDDEDSKGKSSSRSSKSSSSSSSISKKSSSKKK